METLTIDLPAALKAFVHEQVQRGGYGTTSEYIRRLIHADQQRETIDRQLLEALDSGPAAPWTSEDLEALKRRVRERHPHFQDEQ